MTGISNAPSIRAEWLWWLALAAGASFMIPVASAMNGSAIIAWKGLGVGLLAIWAAVNANSRDGWLITAVLVFGAVGDVLIDAVGFVAGGASFAIGHAIAIGLYAANRRSVLTPSQQWLAITLAPATVLISWLLVQGQPDMLGVLAYAVLLGIMASCAWVSRFSRYRLGVGAVLFVASDLLIFGRAGGKIDAQIAGLLIWPLYFIGQALIARGVVPHVHVARTA